MTHKIFLTGASLLALSFATQGWAQEAPKAKPDDASIPTVVVATDGNSTAPYRMGEGVESGTTVIDAQSIEARSPGTGDVLQLLKQTPSVQFSLREGESRGDGLRDLRPSQISINGGRPAENLIILDGVGVNSQMETLAPSVAYSSAPDFDSVGAASPQSIWVDSDLVGQVILRDSNVSAQYGTFTGGVVEINTRDPGKRYRVGGGYSYTSDDLAEYHLSPSYSGSARDLPLFERKRWNISADMPINERTGLLFAYSRQEASTVGNWSTQVADVAGEPYNETNVAQTFLGKLAYQATGDLKLTAQVTHSPYNTVYIRPTSVNTAAYSHGGGTTARLGAVGGHGSVNWDLDLTYAFSDNDKKAADTRFDIRGGLEPYCVGAITVTCENGHTGGIHQRQEDLALKGTWSQPLLGGEWRMGFEIKNVDAEKSRKDGAVYSFSGTSVAALNLLVGLTTVCASATDVACVAGKYAYNQRIIYPAYNAQVSLQTYGLWSEFAGQTAGFDLRLGMRYDYDSFLGGLTFAPRFSAAHDLPFGIKASLGLNRYYGRSYLGYAMREKQSTALRYGRVATTVGANRVWSENWVVNQVTPPVKYSNQNLDAPYTDEASLNLAGALFGGQWRIAAVYREGRDQFARSVADNYVIVNELGVNQTITRYYLTNNGRSTYKGVNLSYVKPWRRNTFTFSTGWSDTKVTADSYYDAPDDDVAGTSLVYYNGKVLSLADLLQENQRQNFAAPFLANGDWNTKWFNDRLDVTFSGRFRGSFERIESTTSFQNVGGTNYRLYQLVDYKPSFDLDANVSYALVRGSHDVILEARIANVLDKIPDRNAGYSSTPWQLGRSMWLGVKVKY